MLYEVITLGIDAMFLAKNPFGETLFRVIVQNRDHRLNDDGTGIDPFVHEMNGAPRKACPILQGFSRNNFV